MVAHDPITGEATSPVKWKKGKDGRPVPDEPHVGSTIDYEAPEAPEQDGFVRGGTTRPPKGESGEPQKLDNEGNPEGSSKKKG